MKYLLTRANILKAFELSLNSDQSKVFNSIGTQSQDSINLGIEPLDYIFDCDLHNCHHFEQAFKLMPLKIEEDTITIDYGYPSIPSLIEEWERNTHFINRAYKKRGELNNIELSALSEIYDGATEQWGWGYDWSDLVYWMNQIGSFLKLVTTYNLLPEDTSTYKKVGAVVHGHLFETERLMGCLDDEYKVNYQRRVVRYAKWLISKYPDMGTEINIDKEWAEFITFPGNSDANLQD